jgi:hypothetical protein
MAIAWAHPWPTHCPLLMAVAMGHSHRRWPCMDLSMELSVYR